MDVEEDAYMERPDGRPIRAQIHNRHGYVDGVKTPDPEGNVILCVRSHDLADWLMGQDNMAVLLDSTGDSPENGDSILFETVTLFDDPDPYEAVVCRPYNRIPGSISAHQPRSVQLSDVLWTVDDAVEQMQGEITKAATTTRVALRELRGRLAALGDTEDASGPVIPRARLMAMKADADHQCGMLHERLNMCGPAGNKMVSSQLDFQQGRAKALADLMGEA
jgi:hypothetical protein